MVISDNIKRPNRHDTIVTMTKEEAGSCLLARFTVILGKLDAKNGMAHIVALSRLTAALLHGLD